MTSSPKIFLVAGEASADFLAGVLIDQIKRLDPTASFFGVGGHHSKSSGMNNLVDYRDVNVVGMMDWITKAFQVFSAYWRAVQIIRQRKPDLAVLIDLPDFNLRLARHLRRLGVPIVYYVSPQVWAWRKYRLRKIRNLVSKLLVVFPFEQAFFAKEKINATCVGHSSMDSITPRLLFRNQNEILSAPRFALLPGSRESEVRKHGPLLTALVDDLLTQFPQASFKVPVASTLRLDFLQKHLTHSAVEWITGQPAHETLAWADLAVVASGTATFETTLVGTPFCLFYRFSKTTEFFLTHVIRYRKFFGLPNWISGSEIVREFVRKKATVPNLLNECTRLVKDPDYRKSIEEKLQSCRTLMGPPGAAERAAKEVHATLHQLSHA